jgi:hypothetical protein
MATRRTTRRKTPARRRSTRKGGTRVTARRAYTRRKPNPVRRRRRPTPKKNPIGTTLAHSAAVAAGSALAALLNIQILEKMPQKAEAEGKEPTIPKAIRDGMGRAFLNIGVGAVIALSIDAFGPTKGPLHDFGPDIGIGMIAYGAGYGVHEAYRKAGETDGLYLRTAAVGRYNQIAESDVRSLPAGRGSAANRMAGLYEGSVTAAY